MSRFLLLALIILCCDTFAQQLPIIPIPASVQNGSGNFVLTASTTLSSNTKNAEVIKVINHFQSKVKQSTGMIPKIVQKGSVQFNLNSKIDQSLGSEGYQLAVNPGLIVISANTPAGLFYGVQTLLQLFPKEIESTRPVANVSWSAPACTVRDYPRFAWRGVMLDVSRHFFSKQYVKEYIDQIAKYKFNRLHLHLTDDQGWRIEIKSLPKLTDVGARRVPRFGTWGTHEPPKPGEQATDVGYYTHDDIREIVAYARERFIEILPEIDVPGHSMAAIASYPQLCVTKDTTIRVNPGSTFSKWFGNGKFEMYIDNTLNPTDENVYNFLDKVFTEVAQLFPFEYIHMGGDECYKGYWERDANVQAFMKKNKIKNAEELQAYFNARVSKIIASKGKKMIGWDEILEGGIADDAAVMSWRGIKGGIEASHKKHFVVMSPNPHYYLDMVQGEASIEPKVYDKARLRDVYNFNLTPSEVDTAYVLGAQGNLWTEHVTTEPQVEYMTYPRALAIAESSWSIAGKKDWTSFINRVEQHFPRFDQAEVNYSPAVYDPIIIVRKNDTGKLTITLDTEASNLDIYYTIDNSIPNHYYNRYEGPIVLPEGTDVIKLVSYRGKNQMGRLITLTYEDLLKRVRK